MKQDSSSQRLPRTLRYRRDVSSLTKELGMPLQVYAPVKTSLLTRMLSIFLIVVGLLILGGFYLFSQLIYTFWFWWQADFIIFVGCIWIVAGLWFILPSLLDPRVHVIVCPKGLICIHRKAKAVPWETITGFWKDMQTEGRHTTPVYKVQCKDDSLYWFTKEIRFVEQLGPLIEQQVVQQLLPQAIQKYDAGAFVAFGEVALDKQGIRVMNKNVPLQWDEVEHIGINESVISIYKNGDYWDWATLPISQVMNAAVLKKLVAYARRENSQNTLTRSIATYNAGTPLLFGSIVVSKLGIQYGETLFAWHKIEGIDLQKQTITLKRQGLLWRQAGPKSVPIKDVPDPLLFKRLVDYAIQGKSY